MPDRDIAATTPKNSAPRSNSPGWMRRWLIAAGWYNLVWGAFTVLYPAWLFDLTGMAPPSYPFIWQCVGMIVGVYGLGYLAAARDPIRHWPIVLVGFLGKIFGPLGYVGGLIRGDVPPEFGVTLLTNDLIWWIPFGMMLWLAFRHHANGGVPELGEETLDLAHELDRAQTQSGESLGALSAEKPLLLVLLRHTGCTFCREAVADLATQRAALEADGAHLVLISQSPPDGLQELAAKQGLDDVPRVHDPEKRLYRALELQRGSFGQLFGVRVWWRGFLATLRGHRFGGLAGDGLQMPGVFLVEHRRVARAYRHTTAADRPDYQGLACGTDGACDAPPSAEPAGGAA